MIQTHPVFSTSCVLVLLGCESALILMQTNRMRSCALFLDQGGFLELETGTFQRHLSRFLNQTKLTNCSVIRPRQNSLQDPCLCVQVSAGGSGGPGLQPEEAELQVVCSQRTAYQRLSEAFKGLCCSPSRVSLVVIRLGPTQIF